LSKKANSILIGAFVLGAVTLMVIAIILFGGAGMFQKKDQIIMYFSGSVNGLNTGAPVNVRGVQVGTVRRINIIFNPETGDFRVPVIADLNPGSIESAKQLKVAGEDGDPIETLIERLGLRAQLQIQSILTSQLYIELDYHPNTELNYYGDGSILEIPTVPMPIDRLVKVLENISIEEVMTDFTSALSAISKLVNAPELMDSVKTINSAFQHVDDLSRDLQVQLVDLSVRIDNTLGDVQLLTAEMNRTFQSTSRLLDEESPQLVKLNQALDEINQAAAGITRAALTINNLPDSPEFYRLNQALEEITRAARSVRELADMLERQPESLVTGKKAVK
jgi:paraquat-inducible protein B